MGPGGAAEGPLGVGMREGFRSGCVSIGLVPRSSGALGRPEIPRLHLVGPYTGAGLPSPGRAGQGWASGPGQPVGHPARVPGLATLATQELRDEEEELDEQ